MPHIKNSPTAIDKSEPVSRVRELLDGDSFCIKPWVHCHVTTLGEVLACCSTATSYGNFKQNSLREVWNGEKIRDFRSAHLSGEKVAGCERCYQAEEVGAFSMRKDANQNFGNRCFDKIAATTIDEHAPVPLPIDYDIRFSNICNLKCRSCYHGSSSSWYKDQIALGRSPSGPSAILRAFDTPDEFWSVFGDFVDDVESIYFAGGEPLLQDEHYEVLRALHKRGKLDVAIYYNSNFSALDYQGTSVTELWRDFTHLTVAASLDSSGARAEVMRHGQSWNQVLKNRERLRTDCPNVDFKVACTVSAMNVWHLPVFHRELIESNVISPGQFEINIVQEPPFLSTQILPAPLKMEVETRLKAHIQWLEDEGYGEVAQRFVPVIDFTKAYDLSHAIEFFRHYFLSLDSLRNEDTCEVFPELASLFQ